MKLNKFAASISHKHHTIEPKKQYLSYNAKLTQTAKL
jgi:hypothetical protein